MLVTRKQALAEGLMYYFTGKPCKHGHISRRFTNGRQCAECNNARHRLENITDEQLERKRRAGRLTQFTTGQSKEGLARQVAAVRKHELKKKSRVPKWCETKAIRKFYEDCPAGYHVDHDWPLYGKLISVLHVLANLKYLPALVNIRKGTKWDQDKANKDYQEEVRRLCVSHNNN